MTDHERSITEAVSTAVTAAIEAIERQNGGNGRRQVVSIAGLQFTISLLVILLGFAFQTGVLVTALNGRMDTIEERIANLRNDVQQNREDIAQNRSERWSQIERLDERVRALETDSRR